MNATGPFMYHIPAATCAPDNLLEQPGLEPQKETSPYLKTNRLPSPLSELLADYNHVADQLIFSKSAGPDGNGSLIIPKRAQDGGMPPCVVYQERTQNWLCCEGGAYWIGWSESHLPHPSWLARKNPTFYYTLDRIWGLPIIRSPSSKNVSLEMTYSFDDRGNVTSELCRRFQPYYELATKALDYLLGNIKLNEAEAVTLALDLLKINYRLSHHEIRAANEAGCEWLKSATVQAILECSCDWELVCEHAERQKKTKTEEPTDSQVPDSNSVTPGV